MVEEQKEENTEKKEENLETIAVCLACSNEWTVRDPGVKKKRKCPICGKYRIKLKSELAAAPDNKDKHEVKLTAPIREKREKKEKISVQPLPKVEENAAPIEEKGEEKAEEKSGGGLMWAAAAVFVIGAAIGVYFLWNPSRKRLAAYQENEVRYNPTLRRLMVGDTDVRRAGCCSEACGTIRKKSSMNPG